jgi:hypothetical protein
LSPAGDNATGASDFKHWYDTIASERTKNLTPKLLRFYEILSRGQVKNAKIEWPPLQEPNARERAEIEKLEADKFGVLIDKGVLFAEEVALAKFGKNSNGEIEIDEKVRRESLEAEKELALNPPRSHRGPPSTSSSATGEDPSDDPDAEA